MFVTMSVKEYIEKLNKRLEELQDYDDDEPIAVKEDVSFIGDVLDDMIDCHNNWKQENGYFRDEEKLKETLDNNIILKKQLVDNYCNLWNRYLQRVEDNAEDSVHIWKQEWHENMEEFLAENRKALDYALPVDDEDNDDDIDSDDE
jgi:hypothetical protein